MTEEERFAPVFESWLHDTDMPAPDAGHSVRQVRARLPQTRQLGRRRWLPAFQRGATIPPEADDTIDHHSSPIPATNGHTPTGIGRTQTMFSPAKAIIAGAVVFAVGGVLLVAQPFGQQGPSVPSAATEGDLRVPSVFTGQIECGPAVGTMTWRNSATMSDPRLAGDAFLGTASLGYEGPGPSGEDGDPVWVSAQVWGDTVRIENDEGAWHGSATTATLSGDPLVVTFVLTGEGGYEGFTALMEERLFNNGMCSVPDDRGLIYSDVRGIIFEGEPPAAPELHTWE